jgi:two-component system NtrC family sensor kinase
MRAIRNLWLASIASHLVFGIPATLLLFVLLGLALRRTKLLYAEADRREAAEAALRQSQRLEAIGRLTGGVAHDFNNLLMVIAGSVERLKVQRRDDKDARYLDMIATAAKRGETLTRQLLSFSRQQALNPQAIDLAKWIPELSDLVRRSLREDVEVAIDTSGDPCPVKVDPGEFELAILNICVNARDAMPNGGKLQVNARHVRLDGAPDVEGLTGEFAAIGFADTGSGIPAEVLPRVFEPFFTTKAASKGTGLGLSQVYGFARQSGGTATIASTPGRGTTVTIYLPCTELEQPAAAAAEERAAAPLGRKRVLVVEDNVAVAEVCKSYLDQLGYAVDFASGARDALQFLEGAQGIDLLLSDIVMPGMSGHELAREVRRLRPGLPIVLMTGFSDSAEEVVRDGFRVIRKPFDLVALERALAAEFGAAMETRENVVTAPS